MSIKPRKQAIMITGANGEIGNALINALSEKPDVDIVAVDLRPLEKPMRPKVRGWHIGDILDQQLMQRLVSEYEVTTIYHLAALLSTRAEFTPEIAHRVNVEGTLELLKLAHQQSSWSGQRTRFIFPSSIAVYGLTSLEQKHGMKPLREFEYTTPQTMYGCNKLYCEHLGRYFAENYQQLAAAPSGVGVDFRALRFPGLISAHTMPSGGTSDYGPEMLHAAASGVHYESFVRPDTVIPFMSMVDAVRAILMLAEADEDRLSQRAYNISAFSISAAQFRDKVLQHFPDAQISFDEHKQRQKIVDSWPTTVDDSPARRDWGWKPIHDEETAFNDYLVPAVRDRYQ